MICSAEELGRADISLAIPVLYLVEAAWGFILDRRYNGPYTLLAASNRQKWKRSIIIMFVETVWIPLAGSLQALISPRPDQWPAFALFWGGLWVVAFPVAVLTIAGRPYAVFAPGGARWERRPPSPRRHGRRPSCARAP